MKAMSKWLTAVLLVTMLFVTACGKAEENKDADQKNADASQGTDNSGGTKADESSVVDGKMKEPVTMTIAKSVNPQDKSLPEGDTIDNNAFTRYLQQKTNVSFQATLTGAAGDSYNQKLQVAIASDDIPDVMIVNEMQLKQLVESDMVEDLTDVYDKYASKVYKDIYQSGDNQALKNATFDGKLMAIPGSVFEADSVELLWIRMDWLKKLNLEVPKTVDDIENVAKAFIGQDPDGNGKADTIGLTGSPDLYYTHGFSSIFSAYHAYPDFWVKDASGKVVNGSTTPETKKGLEKLRQWYADGILDKEFALRKDTNELVAGGKAGMFFGEWWSPWGGPIADAVKVDPKADWQAFPVPLDDQGQFNGKMTNISPSYVVLKKGFAYPEALMLVLNANFDDEFVNISNTLNPSYEPIRLVVDWSDAVTRRTAQFRQYFEGNTDTSQFDMEALRLLDIVKKYKENPTSELEVWQPSHSYLVGGGALLEPMNKIRNLYYGKTKSMETKWTSISKLQTETFLKIIMGNLPLEAFDDYVNQFNKLGGDVITQEVTDAISK